MRFQFLHLIPPRWRLGYKVGHSGHCLIRYTSMSVTPSRGLVSDIRQQQCPRFIREASRRGRSRGTAVGVTEHCGVGSAGHCAIVDKPEGQQRKAMPIGPDRDLHPKLPSRLVSVYGWMSVNHHTPSSIEVLSLVTILPL